MLWLICFRPKLLLKRSVCCRSVLVTTRSVLFLLLLFGLLQIWDLSFPASFYVASLLLLTDGFSYAGKYLCFFSGFILSWFLEGVDALPFFGVVLW